MTSVPTWPQLARKKHVAKGHETWYCAYANHFFLSHKQPSVSVIDCSRSCVISNHFCSRKAHNSTQTTIKLPPQIQSWTLKQISFSHWRLQCLPPRAKPLLRPQPLPDQRLLYSMPGRSPQRPICPRLPHRSHPCNKILIPLALGTLNPLPEEWRPFTRSKWAEQWQCHVSFSSCRVYTHDFCSSPIYSISPEYTLISAGRDWPSMDAETNVETQIQMRAGPLKPLRVAARWARRRL